MPKYVFKMQWEFEAMDDPTAKQWVDKGIYMNHSANKLVLVKHGTSENILKRGKTLMEVLREEGAEDNAEMLQMVSNFISEQKPLSSDHQEVVDKLLDDEIDEYGYRGGD